MIRLVTAGLPQAISTFRGVIIAPLVDPVAPATFSLSHWAGPFNGQQDDNFSMTYNVIPDQGPWTQQNPTEPSVQLHIEHHYFDGATHWVEYNQDVANAGVTVFRRPFSWAFDRTTFATVAHIEVVTGGALPGRLQVCSRLGFAEPRMFFEPRGVGAGAGDCWAIFRIYGGTPNILGIGADGTSLLDTVAIGPAVTNNFPGPGLAVVRIFGGAGVSQAYLNATSFAHARVVPAYGVNITINCALGDVFEIVPTDGVAFNINIPTLPNLNAARTQKVTIRIKNTFGALGVATFAGGAGGFRIGAAWVQPAVGFSRSIEFAADGTNFIETFRSPVDVAN